MKLNIKADDKFKESQPFILQHDLKTDKSEHSLFSTTIYNIIAMLASKSSQSDKASLKQNFLGLLRNDVTSSALYELIINDSCQSP